MKPLHYTTDFEQFWKVYPKKVKKIAAFQAYVKARKNYPEATAEKILIAIESQKKSKQWIKDGGQFIPHPTTWLNQGRWDDEVETEKPNWQKTLDEHIAMRESGKLNARCRNKKTY